MNALFIEQWSNLCKWTWTCDLRLGDERGAILVLTMKALWLWQSSFCFYMHSTKVWTATEWWQFITLPLHYSTFILLYLGFLGCFQKITNPSTDILKCISYTWKRRFKAYNHLFRLLNFQLAVYSTYVTPANETWNRNRPTTEH
jgi:hypothetical protein